MKFLPILLGAVACSEFDYDVPLYPGDYAVTVEVLETTDPFYRVGHTFTDVWTIVKLGPEYQLLINDLVFTGLYDEGQLTFSHMRFSGSEVCRFNSYLGGALTPYGASFDGRLYAAYVFCYFDNPNTGEHGTASWVTDYTVSGTLR